MIGAINYAYDDDKHNPYHNITRFDKLDIDSGAAFNVTQTASTGSFVGIRTGSYTYNTNDFPIQQTISDNGVFFSEIQYFYE